MVEVSVNTDGATALPASSAWAAAAAAGANTTTGPVIPPLEQLSELQYCINSRPPWTETIILAFQHYLVMLGTIVMVSTYLVPMMGGNNGDKARVIQTLLFMSSINTITQTLVGSRLPAIYSGSYAFVIPVMSIINDSASKTFGDDHQRFLYCMRSIQGALIVSSVLNVILGYGRLWGAYSRYFSPVSITPVVCVVGLGLFEKGFPELAKCIEIGLPKLIIMILLHQHFKNVYPSAKALLDKFALIVCVVLIWAFAAILTISGAYNRSPDSTREHCRVDRSNLVSSAPWIKIPYPFQWGTPIFSANHVFGMMGATLVSSAESTGALYATARASGATPPPMHVLGRSVGLQGISMFLNGLFGTVVGPSVSVENIGLIGMTRIGSLRVVQISCAFMLFFSIFGKFGAIFASVPFAVYGAMYCVLFGLVAAVGMSFIQFTNFNSIRNLYIIGLSLFLGISIPQYFNEFAKSAGHGPVNTHAIWFDDILNALFSSSTTVALIVATLLDNTIEAKVSIESRGLAWWVPFQSKKEDYRSEEYYNLPFNLSYYLPARYLH